MDLQMPVMDGLEAARQIRQDARHLPIVAMTAHAMAEQRRQCREAGMDDHIAKPILPEQLTQHDPARAAAPRPTPRPGRPRACPISTASTPAGGCAAAAATPSSTCASWPASPGSQANTLAGIDAALADGRQRDAERSPTPCTAPPPTSAPTPCVRPPATSKPLRDGQPGRRPRPPGPECGPSAGLARIAGRRPPRPRGG